MITAATASLATALGLTLALATYQEASNRARESAITLVEAARNAETASSQAAAAAFEEARAAAEAALQEAFVAAPVAGAIEETFDQRLQEAEAVRDREKSMAMDRMRRELEQLTS